MTSTFNRVPIDVAGTAGAVAAGSTLALEQQLLANAGQPGLTVLAVGYTNTGKVVLSSLGAGNVVTVYASGADFNAGTVLHREFLAFGEQITFTGIDIGAIITTTQGGYGFSEVNFGSARIASVPLLSFGLNSTETFMFSFRQSERTTDNHAFIFIVNGPLESTVSITFGNGDPIADEPPRKMDPWEFGAFHLNGNAEYALSGTAGFMPCTACGFDGSDFRSGALPTGAGPRDARILLPPSNDVITHPRFGQVSAPFPGTNVDWYSSGGATGSFTVSPGSPVDIQTVTGQDTTDYRPIGFTRFLATGLVIGNSGADGAGGDATPACPVSAMSQVVAQPLFVADSGNGDQTSLTFFGPYAGTVRVFEWDAVTRTLNLAYTVPMIRQNGEALTREDQLHAAAGQLSNEPDAGVVALVGQLNPGVCIADVPFAIIAQSNSTPAETVRSQNGTTTTAIVNDDDETLMFGITPEAIAAEIREGADGRHFVRVIDSSGLETWRAG